MRNQSDCLNRLQALGISWDDAVSLRRISMTLHRWHELECGDSNDHASWLITRGYRTPNANPAFTHDENGKPYLEHHAHRVAKDIRGNYKTHTTYQLLPDRERGALDRLARIMKGYPDLIPYVQGDPRGASLYVCRKADIPAGGSINAYYSRGVAVYK